MTKYQIIIIKQIVLNELFQKNIRLRNIQKTGVDKLLNKIK